MKKRTLIKITSLSQIDSLMLTSSSGSGSDLGKGEGNCFFNCMEFVGSMFGLDMNSHQYGCNYHDKDYWPRGGYIAQEPYGPVDYEVDCKGNKRPNPISFEYLQTYFRTEGEAWKEKEKDIENMITHNRKEDKGYVFAVIRKGDDPHAVILDGVTGNGFSYKDPTSGERDVNVSYDDVCYATKIYGLKK